MTMRYLSVCSGIEAASVAFHPYGWKPLAFSEIDKAASRVLAHHYPDTPNWGDMTKFKEWPDATVDVLCGGTPCQSFSVAGLRKGLDDPRGNLMLTFGAIAARYRPRWLVWENVPGVLSSNSGRDFGAFLGMLGQLGYGVAYRVLDAQYVRTRRFPYAVPQRRRRVFVVGYFGDWRRAAAVLFDRESLSGHPAPRRKAGETFTYSVVPSLTRSSRGIECAGQRHGQDPVVDVQLNPGAARGIEFGPSGGGFTDVNPTLDTRAKDGPIRNQLAGAVLCAPVAYRIAGDGSVYEEGDVCAPLTTGTDPSSHAVAFCAPLNTQLGLRGAETSNSSREGVGIGKDGDPSFTLQAGHSHAVITPWAVRRLTPRECERLQGFPDDYALLSGAAKPQADGPRYKQLGNSWAVNCIDWLAERIEIVNEWGEVKS